MAVNLTAKEPENGGYTPPKPFGLYADGTPPHEVLRLLLGSVNIYEKSSGRTIKLSRNEYKKSSRRLCKPERITRFLFEKELTLSEYEKFIVALGSHNNAFFEKIKQELSLSLVAKSDHRYTEAFLYLYRILELISIAFPLLYASTQQDFEKVTRFLKTLMESERDGELKVLKQAVPYISRHGNLGALTFDFSIVGLDVKWVDEFRKQIRTCKINDTNGFEFDPDSDVLFRVPFNSMSSLISQFRNRIFHYRASEANFNLGVLGGSEPICRVLVPEMTHWFALIYAELLRVMAKRQF